MLLLVFLLIVVLELIIILIQLLVCSIDLVYLIQHKELLDFDLLLWSWSQEEVLIYVYVLIHVPLIVWCKLEHIALRGVS